jgi:hypothetical protein
MKDMLIVKQTSTMFVQSGMQGPPGPDVTLAANGIVVRTSGGTGRPRWQRTNSRRTGGE